MGLSATQRYTKFDPKNPKVLHRLDLTDTPTTYVVATTGVPERKTTNAEPPRTERTARQVSATLHHYDTGWSRRIG